MDNSLPDRVTQSSELGDFEGWVGVGRQAMHVFGRRVRGSCVAFRSSSQTELRCEQPTGATAEARPGSWS
jgi:hypothetical protein